MKYLEKPVQDPDNSTAVDHFCRSIRNNTEEVLGWYHRIIIGGISIDNIITLEGLKPISLAIKCKHYEVAKFLISIRNNIDNTKDDSGNTILDYAYNSGEEEIIHLLELKLSSSDSELVQGVSVSGHCEEL